jgi:hypothetical protein
VIDRYLIFSLLLLALVAAPALAAEKSSDDNRTAHGGLICFSVDAQRGQSCDALCGKANAACTAVADRGKNPPLRCGDVIDDTIPPFPVCRCCALEHR